MQQGNEPNAGTRHSIFRHVGKNNGSISYDEIKLIPDIVKTGERTDKGANVVYQKKIDGVRYIVYTDKKSNKELFHDFYSNRKTAGSESLSGESTNTQSSARTSDNAVSAANVGTNSESASIGEENSSNGKKYSTRGTESAERQPLSEKTRKACESVAEALGVDVEWVDHMEANGEFITADEEGNPLKRPRSGPYRIFLLFP